jgi:hypothetical protein
MKQPPSTKTSRVFLAALCLFGATAMGCNLSSRAGAKPNMFVGAIAQDAADKIKVKLGGGDVKVKHIEIAADRMSVVLQDPTKPQNLDEYVYERGTLREPKPLKALTVGIQEFSADKSPLFDLSSVNLSLVPEVCRKAEDRAQIEDGKCELISVDWENARWTRPKEENDRIKVERDAERKKRLLSRKSDPWADFYDSEDLAVTWRVWIKGPHATKDYWVNAKGNVFDYQ